MLYGSERSFDIKSLIIGRHKSSFEESYWVYLSASWFLLARSGAGSLMPAGKLICCPQYDTILYGNNETGSARGMRCLMHAVHTRTPRMTCIRPPPKLCLRFHHRISSSFTNYYIRRNIYSRAAPWFMSALRRRIFGTSGDSTPALTPEQSREGSPAGSHDYRVVPADKLDTLSSSSKKGNGSKRRNFWIFGLGGLFGILLAGFFASSNEFMDLASFTDMNLDSILDVLPAGLINDARDLQVSSSFSIIRSLPFSASAH